MESMMNSPNLWWQRGYWKILSYAICDYYVMFWWWHKYWKNDENDYWLLNIGLRRSNKVVFDDPTLSNALTHSHDDDNV